MNTTMSTKLIYPCGFDPNQLALDRRPEGQFPETREEAFELFAAQCGLEADFLAMLANGLERIDQGKYPSY